MADIIIDGSKSASGVTLIAPSVATTAGSLLKNLTNIGTNDDVISVSVPTLATTPPDFLLTSLGKLDVNGDTVLDRTVWRLRNTIATSFDTNLQGIDSGFTFNQNYTLPGDYDTFVLSTDINATASNHRATALTPNGTVIEQKASSNANAETATPAIANTDNYLIIGTNFSDTLTGRDGNDTLRGNSGSDTLNGNIGDDLLEGGDGNDSLLGGVGNDTLLGGNGVDTLQGQNGNDILVGGVGNDTLLGGLNNDFFRFNSPSEGIDNITDFSVIDDTIQVSNAGFGGGLTTGAVITPAQFVVGFNFTNGTQRFRLASASGGGLFFDPDGNGPAAQTQFANVTVSFGSGTFSNNDIFVIA